jgi:hypothetical protein
MINSSTATCSNVVIEEVPISSRHVQICLLFVFLSWIYNLISTSAKLDRMFQHEMRVQSSRVRSDEIEQEKLLKLLYFHQRHPQQGLFNSFSPISSSNTFECHGEAVTSTNSSPTNDYGYFLQIDEVE